MLKTVREQESPFRTAGFSTALYCFPFAGCATLPFKGWSDWIPRSVRFSPVLFPGHSARVEQQPHRRMKNLAAQLIQELMPSLKGRFVLFGHSMGALVAFEIAKSLRREGHHGPSLLIASGCRAPHLPSREEQLSTLPDAELVKRLQRIPGSPALALNNAELMSLFLPIIRADLEVCDTYHCDPEQPLITPIAALAGSEDATVRQADIEAWTEHTRAGFSVSILPGNHFSMLDPPVMPQVIASFMNPSWVQNTQET